METEVRVQHTPEPWRVMTCPTTGRFLLGAGKGGWDAVICDFAHWNDGKPVPASTNARRIVACVNALAGIETEQIEAGVIAKKALVTKIEKMRGDVYRTREVCIGKEWELQESYILALNDVLHEISKLGGQ